MDKPTRSDTHWYTWVGGCIGITSVHVKMHGWRCIIGNQQIFEWANIEEVSEQMNKCLVYLVCVHYFPYILTALWFAVCAVIQSQLAESLYLWFAFMFCWWILRDVGILWTESHFQTDKRYLQTSLNWACGGEDGSCVLTNLCYDISAWLRMKATAGGWCPCGEQKRAGHGCHVSGTIMLLCMSGRYMHPSK